MEGKGRGMGKREVSALHHVAEAFVPVGQAQAEGAFELGYIDACERPRFGGVLGDAPAALIVGRGEVAMSIVR